jgi:ATP-dependent Clp protease adapter protein ClpS
VDLSVKNEIDKKYRLILKNDDINLFEKVVSLLTNVSDADFFE